LQFWRNIEVMYPDDIDEHLGKTLLGGSEAIGSAVVLFILTSFSFP
jgi:hypothetical protein